ncbi:BolA family protein [Variovorax sp. PCZ-1]|uniref:BolA family protein n=1 Tax=Variovorax sp. PCZ-1 TaxID=2835533 RepID=UPI001BCEC0BE|nr:BolA family transcriptional regulator [Variovorax sp. PCZ-1]
MIATAEEVQRHLQERLQATRLEVLDESAAHAGHAGNPEGATFGTHLRVRIASPQFANVNRIAAHRLVYDACQGFLERGLHALAIEVVK